MGVPAAKAEPPPRVRARARVRAKAQLTLPEEIRRALHISEGDEVEFDVMRRHAAAPHRPSGRLEYRTRYTPSTR